MSDFSPTPASVAMALPCVVETVRLPLGVEVEFNTPPEIAGVKTTLIVQFAPLASDTGQLFVCANWPVVAMLVTVTALPVLLVMVTGSTGEVVPIDCPPKLMLGGVKLK